MVFLVIVLHKVSKVVEEANRTVKLVSSDVDVLLHQADGIMTKANTLLDDVNGKVATIDAKILWPCQLKFHLNQIFL